MVADADRPNGRRRTETREHEIRGHAKPLSRDRAVGPGDGRLAIFLRRSSVSARAPGADGGQSGQSAAPSTEAQPNAHRRRLRRPARRPPRTPPGAPATTTRPRRSAQVLAASPRVMIDTPSIGGSIDLKGGKIDDIVLKDYHETVDPKSPNVRLFSPPGAPDAYWAETGFVSPAGAKTPSLDTVWTADRPDADPDAAGDADLGQWRGSRLQARHRGRRQIHVHDHGLGRELRRRAGDRAALRAHPAPRQADRRRLFGAARGLCRRDRRRRRAGSHLREHREGDRQGSTPSRATAAGSASPTNIGARRSFPAQTAPIEARFSASGTVQPVDYQADFLGKEQIGRAGRHGRDDDTRLRRRQGGDDDRQLRRPSSASRSSI